MTQKAATAIAVNSQAPQPDRAGRDWAAILWMMAGIVVMIATELSRDRLEARFPSKWVPLLLYAVEHLGAVVFAAMVVREALERQAQEAAVREVSKAVKEKVAEAFADVDKIVEKFDEKITLVYNQLEHIRTITGGNLYGKRLSDKGRDEISKLLNAVFYRPSYDLVLTLARIEGEQVIDVKMEATFRLENISEEVQDFAIGASLENLPFRTGTGGRSAPSRFERFEYGPDTEASLRQAELQPLTFGAAEQKKLKENNILRECDDELVFEYKPGLRMAPREIYFVKMLAVQQMRESELFVWNMEVVTQELKVTLYLQGGLNKTNFSVKMRPIDATKCKDETDKASPDTYQWKIVGPILPKQGMRIWWSPQAGVDPANLAPDAATAGQRVPRNTSAPTQ